MVGFAVFIHGGFWRVKYDLSHANPFCAALAARGIVTANLEYRRVNQVGRGWPGTFEDVVAGVKAALNILAVRRSLSAIPPADIWLFAWPANPSL